MFLTKSEMEDIWHNKPIGYLDKIKKSLKGTKNYNIVLEPYNYARMQSEVFVIRAKNTEEAVREAKAKFRIKYPSVVVDGYFVKNIT